MTSTSNRCADRIVCLVALVAFLVAPLRATAAPSATTRSAKEEYQDGLRAYAAARFDEAAAAFERAYALAPRPLILFNVGQARRKMGDFDRALVAYRTYVATGAGEPAATLDEARGYIAQIEGYLQQSQAPPPPPPSATAPPPQAMPPATPSVTPNATPTTTNDAAIVATPPSRPLYKSPALWGGVAAGVVVLGLAIGLGVGLGTRSHDPDSTLGTQTATFH